LNALVSESDQPSAGNPLATQADTPRPVRRSEVTARRDLYRIAYQEGQRTLDDEQDELNRIRDRAVQFTAFVGAATAFLVGTGLSSTSKDAVYYGLASAASALSAILIIFLFGLLAPIGRHSWAYRISTDYMVNRWIEADIPQLDEAGLLRAMTFEYGKMHRHNEAMLRSIRRLYRWLIATGAAQVTVWAALVWIKG
jgi:hypothetical protein